MYRPRTWGATISARYDFAEADAIPRFPWDQCDV